MAESATACQPRRVRSGDDGAAQAVFTLLLRNAKLDDHAASGMRGELKLFQRFNQMIDSHYHQHWTVPDYARELHLTESRLTDICRRFANRSPKRLIFDRQLREAKRLLLFSDSAVNEIRSEGVV